MARTEAEARTIVNDIAAKRRDELRSALTQLRGSLEINLSVWGGPESIPVELLQNADDAFENGAADEDHGFILYRAGDNFLLVAHNGPPFTAEDVDYISSIGRPHKKPGRQSGWMDFGFKSVFRLTDCPMIFSGPFRFKFEYDRAGGQPESILIPLWVTKVPTEAEELYEKGYTVFYLPLRTDAPELAEFCQSIDFAPLSLVFLRHIRRITVETKHGLKQYNIEPVKAGIHTVIETRNGQVRSRSFRVLSRSIPIRPDVRSQDRVIRSGRGSLENTTLFLAFHLDDQGNLVSTDGQLYCFVPTNIKTGLKFDINGDFLLNAERTAIDRNLRWNDYLLGSAADLLVEAIDTFRKHRRWRYQFYEVLPTGVEAVLDIVEQAIVKRIREYCQNHPIVISHDNKWRLPSTVAILPERLQRVLEPSDINLDGYVNMRVTGIDFIKSLGVEDFRGEKEGELVEKFLLENKGHLSRRPVKWFIGFYSYLSEALFADDHELRMSRWYTLQEKIRNLPIILTETENVRPQDAIYPTKPQRVPKAIAKMLRLVHPEIVRSRGSRKILVEGLKTPDASRESIVRNLVREAEKGVSEGWSKKQCWEILRFIHSWLRKNHWNPRDLQRGLSYLRVPTSNGWLPAKDAYFEVEELKQLLPDAPLVKMDMFRTSRADWERTLRVLGVADLPKVESTKGDFTRWGANSVPPDVRPNWDVYWEWLWEKEIGSHYSTQYRRVTEIHWAPWLTKLSRLERVTRKQILKRILQGWSSYYSNFATTTYEWFYRNENRMSVSSYFSWQLRNEEWLPTTMGLMKPGPYVFPPLRQIRVLLGDLVPYMDCDEDDAKNARNFLDHIGVKAELDVEALVSALAHLASRNPPPEYWTEERLDHLKELYRALAKQIDPTYPHDFTKLPLLKANKQFADAPSLVWNDNPQIGQMFAHFDTYAWVPTMERPLVERLFSLAGVRPLSELVVCTTVGDGSWDASRWVERLRTRANFLYSLVAHHLQQEAVKDVLRFLCPEPRVVGHCDLKLKLIWDNESRVLSVPAYFERVTATLHLTEYATESDVAFAFAEGLRLRQQTEQIERILNDDPASLVKRFERWGITVVEISAKPTPEVQSGSVHTEMVTPGDHGQEPPGGMTADEVPQADVVTEQREHTVSAPGGKEQEGPAVCLPEPTVVDVTGTSPRRPHSPTTISREQAADITSRKEAEQEAMAVAIWFEREMRQREVKDVSRWKSYDLESFDPACSERVERYIEVKAHFSSRPVELTAPEKEQSQILGDYYWLYVVAKTENGYCLHAIQNPVNCNLIKFQEHHTVIWHVVGWEAVEPTFVPRGTVLYDV